METDSTEKFINNYQDFLMDESQDKDYLFHAFRNFLIATIKWIEMSSLFITFFYSDSFFKVIQEKINDPKQASCVPFVLLSIFITDIQMFEEIHCSDSNYQNTFVSNLQEYLRCTIDKLTELFPSLLSKEVIGKLATESFDSIINILCQKTGQNDDDEGNQFLDKLSIDDIEQNNDRFFDEVKNTIFSKLNHRKRLIEQYVTIKWRKVIDYMQQQDHLKLCLVQNSEKSIQIFNLITTNFQQLKSNTTTIKQTVEKICQRGMDKIDIYLSEHDEMNENQSNSIKIKEDYHRNTISGENESEQKAYELFCQLNEEMCKANFDDFPILFGEFY